jgi:hypothetical protein
LPRGERRQRRPDRHAFGPELPVEQHRQRALRAVIPGGKNPDAATVFQALAVPFNADRRLIRRIGTIPARLNRCFRHFQRRNGMAAPAAPALRIQRVGNRVRQQLAPAFAQRHAVRLLAFKHRIGKIVFIHGRDKTVAAAPLGLNSPCHCQTSVSGNAFEGLRTGILMVIGHAGDIEPDAFDR